MTGQFVKARSWFEKAAAQGDQYAMGHLAIFLDTGPGGPRDRARGEQSRKARASIQRTAGLYHIARNARSEYSTHVHKEYQTPTGSEVIMSFLVKQPH